MSYSDTECDGGLACYLAAKNGQIECLKYAHENGCRWNKQTCSYAAEYGHLGCLKYAHEHGCPWDEWTCRLAAMNGHLECIHYAWKNGCEWNAVGEERSALIRRMVREIYWPKLRHRFNMLLLVRWWQFKLVAASVNFVPDSDGCAPKIRRLEYENDFGKV